jgi:hypothetical protein
LRWAIRALVVAAGEGPALLLLVWLLRVAAAALLFAAAVSIAPLRA